MKPELEKVALDVFSNWHFKCSEHWHGMVLKPHAFFHVQLKGFISNRSRNITKIENKINKIVDRIYKNFSELVGVANICEYEETQLREAQEISKRRIKLSS